MKYFTASFNYFLSEKSAAANRLAIFFLASSLMVVVVSYAVLINAAAGLTYKVNSLAESLTKAENELVQNQTLLLEVAPVASKEANAISMEDIGSDLSYLYTNAIVADSSHLPALR